MEIQSKKQLLNLLNVPLNSKDEKKLEKLFSLSRRNYFKVVLEDNFLCISYENEYIKAWDKISLNNISTLKEVIHLKNILFKESQKQIVIYDTSKAYYYIQFYLPLKSLQNYIIYFKIQIIYIYLLFHM